jgi:hypothetical protein
VYPIGWSIGEAERAAITRVPTSAWSPAITADRDVRDGAQVAEPTGWLEPVGWPQGMRVMVRRERPHPGGQLTRCAQRDGWRHTALATDIQVGARRWRSDQAGRTTPSAARMIEPSSSDMSYFTDDPRWDAAHTALPDMRSRPRLG